MGDRRGMLLPHQAVLKKLLTSKFMHWNRIGDLGTREVTGESNNDNISMVITASDDRFRGMIPICTKYIAFIVIQRVCDISKWWSSIAKKIFRRSSTMDLYSIVQGGMRELKNIINNRFIFTYII